jgi:hypothetical protein
MTAARLGLLGCLCTLALPLGAVPAAGVASPESTVPVHAIRGRHARYVVEVNAKGQVSKVRERSRSRYPQLDAATYGNVVQIFVRTKDGRAVAGVYRVSYDYNPKTKLIQRHVKLLHAGGVDPWALGLVDVYKQIDADQSQKTSDALGKLHLATPAPAPMR